MHGGDEIDSLRGYRYYRRTFINRPGHHATAFIYATVERTKADDLHAVYPCLTIADCNRSISLSIDVEGEDARTNSLYKLDSLIETLREFRTAFLVECELQRERERRAAQAQKLPVRA